MAYRRKTIVANPDRDEKIKEALRIPKSIKNIGLTIPFNNPYGIFHSSITNKEQVLSNLRNLLLTAKGERYMLADFGTDLRSILFENISSEEEFSSRIRDTITSAIGTWLPYLVITNLSVDINMTDDGRIDDPSHAVGVFLRVLISGTNIYLPIRIFISETANIRIEEALN